MSLEEAVLAELATTRKQVNYLLERYPESRNNDTYLEWLWMRYFKGINLPWIEYQKLQEFSLETVRRIRQKIQSEGSFLPTREEVRIKRRIKQEVYHETFSPAETNEDIF